MRCRTRKQTVKQNPIVGPPPNQSQRPSFHAITLMKTVARGSQVHFRFGKTAISVTHSDKAAVLKTAAEKMRAGTGFALATINLDHLTKLPEDRSFQKAYAAQDIVVADGNPIVWLSRLAGRPVSLVPGSDLVVPLARIAAETGRPLAMIGSTDQALQSAAARLKAGIPGLETGPCIAPPFGFDPEGAEARRILAEIAAVGPCLCLLALGAPKQEKLAALGRELAPQAGFASIGAGVDFLSGHQTRAPLWVRKIAMEWLWRMLQQPARLIPRYAACFAILPGHCRLALRQRRENP